jgi:hypothetical protein
MILATQITNIMSPALNIGQFIRGQNAPVIQQAQHIVNQVFDTRWDHADAVTIFRYMIDKQAFTRDTSVTKLDLVKVVSGNRTANIIRELSQLSISQNPSQATKDKIIALKLEQSGIFDSLGGAIGSLSKRLKYYANAYLAIERGDDLGYYGGFYQVNNYNYYIPATLEGIEDAMETVSHKMRLHRINYTNLKRLRNLV